MWADEPVHMSSPEPGRIGMTTKASVKSEPRRDTQKMRQRLQDVQDDFRMGIEKVDEPRLKALLETSAEVLEGLKKAFSDYERKDEPAWR
jgi:hypothetical protein